MLLSDLAGNDRLKQQLGPRLAARQLGHALILSGPAGSGKHTLASIIAGAMVCSGDGAAPCGSCSDCKKASAGIHPDIITVSPEEEGKAITVDQIRQIRADAHIRPNEAPRKVYVVEQAHRLRDEAQNAMLKLLEEGPAYAVFLLLAENGGALLTTVRSRCEELLLTPPAEQQVDEQVRQLARDLADRWLDADEWGLMELCVSMEKYDRHQLCAVLDCMHTDLGGRLARHPDRRRVARALDLLRRMQQAAAQNVGTGHLVGLLCAEAKGGSQQ